MKALASLAKIIAPVVFLIVGCNSKEETPTPDPEFPSIVQAYDFDTSSFGVEDTAKVVFTQEFDGFGNLIFTDVGFYQLQLISLSLGGVELDTLWVGSHTLYIWSQELLPADEELTFNFELEWLDRETDATYNTLEEVVITTKSGSLPVDEIIATYPVDRQLYFLQDEYENGFLVVDRLPADASSLKASFINDSEELFFESDVTKNADDGRLDFNLPDFENEKVYRIELSDGENVLRTLDFRTSKHNRLSEKLGNLVQDLDVTRQIHRLWEQYFLWQNTSISEEGFDRAEASFGTETVESADYNYCNGLIQLEFNPEGNPWYDDWLYPIVYAPFPDPDFSAEPAHHPNLGDQSFLAMHFLFDDELPYLMDAQLLAENTTATFESDFAILNYVTSAALYDFKAVQADVINEYINDETFDDRVGAIIWAQYALPLEGNYKFNMNYRLPDGTVTSSLTYDMVLGE